MPGALFLAGERVGLRTIESEDVTFLARLINDPEVRGSIGAHVPKNEHEEREWVESRGEDSGVELLVCIDGEAVGTVGLKPPDEAWGRAEIGYAIVPEHWNNGYATDAVGAMVDYAFDERRLAKVYANVYGTNPASARVLEKVGFEREARLRAEAFVGGERVDLLRYGLLAGER